MKKIALALSLATVGLSSCLAGPHQFARTVDDWDHKIYVQQPWISAAMYVVPVFPFMKFGAMFADFFVSDAYAFWFKDAWDMKGTGFEHYNPEWTDGRMKSLLLKDAGFVKIHK